MHPQWAATLREDLRRAGVPVWMKQWGEWGPAEWKPERRDGETAEQYKARADATGATHAYSVHAHTLHHQLTPASQRPSSAERTALPPGMAGMRRLGKDAAGHLLGGREILELPAAAYMTPVN
jgi:hypothetical protein